MKHVIIVAILDMIAQWECNLALIELKNDRIEH